MNLHIILLVVVTVVETRGHVSCIGENGKPVDMFLIYKLPKKAADPGNKYLYLDSNNMNFKLGDKAISSVLSPPGRTLDQVYKQYVGKTDFEQDEKGIYTKGSEKLAHMFYNDQAPDGKSRSRCGHTKGELAFDEASGFWVIQSVPHFPTETSKGYGYPHSGLRNGQMMLCVTFKAQAFKDIALQLKFHRPHIYDGNIPDTWKRQYKDVYNVLHGVHVTRAPYSRVASLTSLGGVEYTHFAKAGKFHRDLYHDLVASKLQTNLLTETWQHGHRLDIGPSCEGNFTVVDIKELLIKLPDDSYSFDNMADHSKFAIGNGKHMPYVCVGDINRQTSQFKRGGGTMCVKNIVLWEIFHGMIKVCDSCDKN